MLRSRGRSLRKLSAASALLFAFTGCSSDDDPSDDAGTPGGNTRDASTTADVAAPDTAGDAEAGRDERDALVGMDGAETDVGRADTDGGGGITVNRPELVPATEERIASLKVPSGFRINVLTRNVMGPRMLAVGPDGSVYVTSPMTSQVWRLRDENGNGNADDANERTLVASVADSPALAGVHGITIVGNDVYLASIKAVFSATLANGQFMGLRQLVGDLPDGGQHPNRTLGVGPDGKLYVSVGSDCNACAETNTEHATMLRIELDGNAAANPPQPAHPVVAHIPMTVVSPRVYASGLRNTIGFDWHPVTGEFWGSDHGSDGLGENLPPDELNRLSAGASYGWPYCWGDRQPDPIVDDPSMMLSKEQYCPQTQPSVLSYPAHSAPIAFLFYRGTQFPADFAGDAFVAFRGSWNRAVATGYKIVRVHFENGMPRPRGGSSSAIEDFLTGFLLDNDHQFGRVAGLAVDATGALLVSEDSNGIIYRVAYGSGDAGVPIDADVQGDADVQSDADVADTGGPG
jgi:glucose/arabinose dehydrogenase